MTRTPYPLLLLACLAAACAPNPRHRPLAAPRPAFSPQAFFAGRTVGNGVLRIGPFRSRRIQVVGDGHVERDGTLVLEQRVEEDGRPPRHRVWRLHPVGGGGFAGTLSDARGPVLADVGGNLLHVRFTAKNGLGIEQWLYLQPGGQAALNRMVVRKYGIPVASLRETIRRSS